MSVERILLTKEKSKIAKLKVENEDSTLQDIWIIRFGRAHVCFNRHLTTGKDAFSKKLDRYFA